MVKMTVKIVMNIIIRKRGKWGSSNSPILAVPAVTTVDKQAIEVTWNEKKMHLRNPSYDSPRKNEKDLRNWPKDPNFCTTTTRP